MKYIFLTSNLKILIFLGLSISLFINNTKYEDVIDSLKEVAYSYYMRGINIQYNNMQWCLINAEEATKQNVKHLDCAAFVRAAFLDLLNITLPYDSHVFLYTKQNIGSPEIVGYSYINDKNIPEMKIYDPKAQNNYTIINPTFEKIVGLIKVGDILAGSHAMLVFDLIKNEDGKIIDAIMMHSAQGIGRSRIETKIGREIVEYNGTKWQPYLTFIFYNEKLNTEFNEGIKEGSVGLIKLSDHPAWVNIGDINQRSPEYTIFRFINKDSNGNAILNYKNFYPHLPNAFLNNDIIKSYTIFVFII